MLVNESLEAGKGGRADKRLRIEFEKTGEIEKEQEEARLWEPNQGRQILVW